MKLGTGKNKYKFKIIYELTNRVTIKNVYADNIEEALNLFDEYYKDYLDVRILKIEELINGGKENERIS